MRTVGTLSLIWATLWLLSSSAFGDTAVTHQFDPRAACTWTPVLEPIEQPAPRYPSKALREWSEGNAQFMATVAADGSLQDLETLDYVGPTQFRDVARTAVAKWRYRPLVVNGTAVPVYGTLMEITFRLSPEENMATHQGFVSAFKQARQKIKDGQYDEAAALLDRARQGQLNLYELATASYASALIADQKNDRGGAIFHMRHALLHGGAFLDDETARAALELDVQLETRNGSLAEALCAFEALKARAKSLPADDPAVALMARLMSAINAPAPLAIDGVVFADPATTMPPSWDHKMLRPRFYFAQASAGVTKFKLICARTVVEETINPEMIWTVPPDAGNCRLYVRGQPGATFKLVEEW